MPINLVEVISLRVDGVSHNNTVLYPQIDAQKKQVPEALGKDQVLQLLNYMLYQQNGLAMKLVRIATENYVSAQFDMTA
ncbi:MAG: hypothetical protein ACPLHI_00400 [Pseudothermotoga sp.]